MKWMQFFPLTRPQITCARRSNLLSLDCVHTFFLQMSWNYSRDCPVLGSIIVSENPVGMFDLGAGSGGIIGW